jgi:hypothetical protein
MATALRFNSPGAYSIKRFQGIRLLLYFHVGRPNPALKTGTIIAWQLKWLAWPDPGGILPWLTVSEGYMHP